jgi:hypothetical protein
MQLSSDEKKFLTNLACEIAAGFVFFFGAAVAVRHQETQQAALTQTAKMAEPLRPLNHVNYSQTPQLVQPK